MSNRSRWRVFRPSRRLHPNASRCSSSHSTEIDVVTPDEYMGDVLGDLSSRRGHILGTEAVDSSTGDGDACPCDRARGRAAQLCRNPAVDDSGSRDLHEAVQRLRRSAARGGATSDRRGHEGEGSGGTRSLTADRHSSVTCRKSRLPCPLVHSHPFRGRAGASGCASSPAGSSAATQQASSTQSTRAGIARCDYRGGAGKGRRSERARGGERLRPSFLQNAGGQSSSITQGPQDVVVYVDHTRMGGPSALAPRFRSTTSRRFSTSVARTRPSAMVPATARGRSSSSANESLG